MLSQNLHLITISKWWLSELSLQPFFLDNCKNNLSSPWLKQLKCKLSVTSISIFHTEPEVTDFNDILVGFAVTVTLLILKAIQQQSSSETEGEGGNTADASSEEEGDRVEEDGKGKRKNEKAGSKRKKSYTSKVIFWVFLLLLWHIYNQNTVHLMDICSSFSILIPVP